MSKNGKNKPSIGNWMGTLILYSIPGVNVIFLIFSIIFAKTSAKRNFAIAGILLLVIWLLLMCAAFVAFPDQLTQLSQKLREAGQVVSFS